MELSQGTLRGLQVAGLSSIDDKTFSRLSQLVIQSSLGKIDTDTIKSKPHTNGMCHPIKYNVICVLQMIPC